MLAAFIPGPAFVLAIVVPSAGGARHRRLAVWGQRPVVSAAWLVVVDLTRTGSALRRRQHRQHRISSSAATASAGRRQRPGRAAATPSVASAACSAGRLDGAACSTTLSAPDRLAAAPGRARALVASDLARLAAAECRALGPAGSPLRRGVQPGQGGPQLRHERGPSHRRRIGIGGVARSSPSRQARGLAMVASAIVGTLRQKCSSVAPGFQIGPAAARRPRPRRRGGARHGRGRPQVELLLAR
jgi:hypothetical protein